MFAFRLGDSRDTVREKAQLLLNKLLECKVVQPQTLLDKLQVCFKHKNAKIREEYLQTIVNTLNELVHDWINRLLYFTNHPCITFILDTAHNLSQ